ncbi:hypothetical protein DFH09DRAFT_580430 [Mycena vulgaris]|nr:hypothetical protein DFH09DRAFT_580430 [Mycena vulgaris]
MLALVEFIRSEARTPSSVDTPTDTGLPRNARVIDQVKIRDEKCRLTGAERVKKRATADQMVQLVQVPRMVVPKLQVVHGLPFQVGQTTFGFVKVLTGIDCHGWVADSVGNAFLAQPTVHDLFGSFRIFLEWTTSGIIIRGRSGAGTAEPFLSGIVNDRFRTCNFPGEFLDIPIRPRLNTNIPDIEQKYFVLHKFIGEIVWMCGVAEPDSDGEEDEDVVVSASNIDKLIQILQSPAMEFVPREEEGIFGLYMVLVPKNG